MKKIIFAISIATFVMSAFFANAQDLGQTSSKVNKDKTGKAVKEKNKTTAKAKKGKTTTTVKTKEDKTATTTNEKTENATVANGKQLWNAPANSASIKNPVTTSPESINDGKALYAKYCQSCHGKTGLGDGTKASELKTEPGDFSKSAFQSQSDGSVFYKISEGKDDMPSFKKKMTDANDIWNVVNYIRTLKK